jgi:hypothetical protein
MDQATLFWRLYPLAEGSIPAPDGKVVVIKGFPFKKDKLICSNSGFSLNDK